MSKIPSIFIAALVLTNSITGAGWWRSQERVQYVTSEAKTFAQLYAEASKEVYDMKKTPQQSIVKPQNSAKYKLIAY
jgi:hypothetical protein